MQTKYLMYAAIIAVLASISGNVFQYCSSPKEKLVNIKENIDTSKIKQSFRAELEAELRAELKPITKYKTITRKVNIDSLWLEAKRYWLEKLSAKDTDTLNQFEYIAEADTTYQDSTFTAKISFISPMPLHPDSRFNIISSWYNTEINHNTTIITEKQSTFWERLFENFNYSINVGFGQGLINKQFDFYYGIGISYNIKKIF